MPRKDATHEAVKNALIKDDWTIIADPLRIKLVRHRCTTTDRTVSTWCRGESHDSDSARLTSYSLWLWPEREPDDSHATGATRLSVGLRPGGLSHSLPGPGTWS